MRPQPDHPPSGGQRKRGRKERERKPGRGRVLVIVAAAVVFILAISVRGIAGFYTDYLWFELARAHRRVARRAGGQGSPCR